MKYLLILIILITYSKGFSQALTFDDLIRLQSQDLESVNDFLIGKGWSFSSSKKETETKYGTADWGLNITEYGEEKKASAWFSLDYSLGYTSRIYYQVFHKTPYMLIKSKIVSLGMKVVDSSIEKDALRTTYFGKNFAVVVTTELSKSAISSYQFKLYAKEDYIRIQTPDDIVEVVDHSPYIKYFATLIADDAFIWSSSNMSVATSLYTVKSPSRIGVINEGEQFSEVVVDGIRGFIATFKLKKPDY